MAPDNDSRTLRLVAEKADACNLFGEPDVVAHKVDVLCDHCNAVGRDPAAIEVTQLSNLLVAGDSSDLAQRIEHLRQGRPPEQFIEQAKAGIVDDHIDRFAALARAGVDTVVVSLADIGIEDSVTNFAPVIDHFRP